jgi:hypothetical protein
MTKPLLLIHLLFSICSIQILYAQQNEQIISASGGVSFLARQDLVYSPFVHDDISRHSYRLRYQRAGKYFHFAEAGFTYNSSKLTDPYEMDMGDHEHVIMPHEFLHIDLSYGFGKGVQPNGKYRAWIGGAIQSDLQAGFYNFGLSNMFGDFLNQSAQVWYRRTYSFKNKHQLSMQVALPILSWIARPPHMAEDDEFIENISSHNSTKILLAFIGDGQLATWNRLQRLNLAAEYRYPITGRAQIGAEYRFDFIHTNIPRTLLSYQHQLNLNAILKF